MLFWSILHLLCPALCLPILCPLSVALKCACLFCPSPLVVLPHRGLAQLGKCPLIKGLMGSPCLWVTSARLKHQFRPVPWGDHIRKSEHRPELRLGGFSFILGNKWTSCFRKGHTGWGIIRVVTEQRHSGRLQCMLRRTARMTWSPRLNRGLLPCALRSNRLPGPHRLAPAFFSLMFFPFVE